VRRVVLLSLALPLLGGCVHRTGPTGPPTWVPLEGPLVASAYAPAGPAPAAKLRLESVQRGYEIHRVDLPARVPASLASPDRVALEGERQPIRMTWYRPVRIDAERGPRPAVVVSPILGSSTDFVSDFAAAFARRGWHALLVRRLKVDYDPERPIEQVEEGLAIAVSRQVQALDWLLAQADVDASRIASFGISAGGITGAMVAGVDRRYVAHVMALAGGPLADVLVDSDEKGLRELTTKAMARTGLSKEAMRERLREVIRTDPVLLAPCVDPARVLLVLARYDQSVPARYGEVLHDALGSPQTKRLPLGHYTSVLALPFVRGETVAFLARKFGEE
jgi:dienelactone hydrolase